MHRPRAWRPLAIILNKAQATLPILAPTGLLPLEWARVDVGLAAGGDAAWA